MPTILDLALQGLSWETPRRLVHSDKRRLAGNYYGPFLVTGTLERNHLFIGARSGLPALLMASSNPDHRIAVIDRDRHLTRAIEASAKNLGIRNLRFHQTLDAYLDEATESHPEVGVACVDAAYLSVDLLEQLKGGLGICHLCGDFSETNIDPLWLHRFSRETAETFHWHDLTTRRPLAGRHTVGPDVSIIVPAYGVEAYLDHCMESLVTQTLDPLEIIVVDDGARDRSGKIADQWARRDSRVRVIHQQNAGCAAARQNGIDAATGFAIGLVDGDDWVDPPMFQALAESVIRFGSDIAQCGYRECGDGFRANIGETYGLTQGIGDGNGLVADPKDLIPGRPTIWRRLYRRDFLKDNDIGFPRSIKRFDDLPFHFMTLALAQRLSVVAAPYYNYRQERPGQDIGITDERLNVHFPIFALLKGFVRQHHSRDLEERLFLTQLASHEWSDQVIESRLRHSYRRAAKFDIFGDCISLTPAELVRAAWRSDIRRAYWAFKLLFLPGTGRSEWNEVNTYSG